MNNEICTFKHNVDCPICTELYKDYDQITVLVRCKHMFHKACIDEWLKYKRECPTCKMPLLDNAIIQKIVTMCTLNYFCNCLNSQQFNQASPTLKEAIENFIVDDIITIDTDTYYKNSRSETIIMINQLRTDISRLLQSVDDDSLMDHPIINQYNEFVYGHRPFQQIVERYPTNSIMTWFTEMFLQ